MAREFLGNIKGPQGARGATGPKGADADLSSSVIGTENLIDLSELINYDTSGSQAVDLETGTILYRNTGYFIRNEKFLTPGTYFYRVEDYTEHSDYYAGRIRLNVIDSNSNYLFQSNTEKGHIYSFEVTSSGVHYIEFRVAGASRKSGFIKKPMLVKGDGIANWQLSERDRNAYNNTKTQNLIEIGETRAGNIAGSVSVDYPKGRINFSNVSWTILGEEMPLENDIYYLRLPAFTSNRSGNKATVTIRNDGSQLGDHSYVVGQNETVEIDLRDAGSTTLSINFMLANGQSLDGFIEKPLLTSDKVLGQWAPTEKEQREVPYFQEGGGDRSMYSRLHRNSFEGTDMLDMAFYGTSGEDYRVFGDEYVRNGEMVLPKGTYLFTWSAMFESTTGGEAVIRFHKNGISFLRRDYSIGVTGSVPVGVTVVFEAEEGDSFYVTTQKESDSMDLSVRASSGTNRMSLSRIS